MAGKACSETDHWLLCDDCGEPIVPCFCEEHGDGDDHYAADGFLCVDCEERRGSDA